MQLIQFIAGLAVLILIHELGHFLAARLLKVKVDEFGIGFPPRLLGTAKDCNGKRRWFGANLPDDMDPDNTVLSINWIPLGGFVRPRGENDPAVPDGLAAANPWVRLGVLFAGPMMNLAVGVLLAILLFYSVGERDLSKVLVEQVAAGSPAESANLLPGDLFVSINDQPVTSAEELQRLVNLYRGQPTLVVVQRGDETLTVTLVPRLDPPQGQGAMGVELGNPTRPTTLLRAVGSGFGAVVDYTQGLMLLPMRMMRGEIAPEEGRIVGYKGMYDIYQRLASPLQFFAIISISLGIMNLLPIPALDGGRILLTMPEILIRRRIPAQYENAIHAIGFALLILLLIYVNLQDFLNPIQLP